MRTSNTTAYLTSLILFGFTSLVFAQTEDQKTQTSGKVTPASEMGQFIPSPLSATFGIKSYGNQLNVVGKTDLNVTTQTVNLGPAVAAYANIKDVELSQARLDALAYLGLVRTTDLGQLNDPKQPTYKLLSADRFEITALSYYFDSLPARIKSFECGKVVTIIEYTVLKLDDTIQQEARKFLDADSVEHISGEIPGFEFESLNRTQAGGYEVGSSLQTSTSMPTTVGQMTLENYQSLLQLVQNRNFCEVATHPRLVTLPGQDGVIQQGSSQPFVVGLEVLEGDFTQALQPIIQTIENGDYLKATAIPVNEKLEVDLGLAFADLKSVDQVSLTGAENGAKNAIQVQTPAQQVREVRLKAMIPDDRVLLIDPYYTRISESVRNGKKVFREHNLVALIRARVVELEEFQNE